MARFGFGRRFGDGGGASSRDATGARRTVPGGGAAGSPREFDSKPAPASLRRASEDWIDDGGERRGRVDERPLRPAPPEGASDEDYKWHSYKVYPSGHPDAVEFIDLYKSFGRAHVLRG